MNFDSHQLLAQLKSSLRYRDYILKLALAAVFLVMIEFISYTSIAITLLSKLGALVIINVSRSGLIQEFSPIDIHAPIFYFPHVSQNSLFWINLARR